MAITRPCRERACRLLALFAAALVQGAAVDAAPGVRSLVEIGDIDSLALSPDGKHLAFRTVRANVERNSYDLSWNSAELETGKVLSIGSAGEPIYRDPGLIDAKAPIWAPDGRSIIFRSLVDGAIGAWQARIDGGPEVPLVIRDEDVESLELSADGKGLDYEVGPSRERIRRAERDEYDSGILVDASVDLAQNLYRGGSVNGRMASQRLAGYWFVRAGLLWREARQKRHFDLASRRDEPVGSPEAVPPFSPPSDVVSARSLSGDLAQASWDGKSGSLTATLAGGVTTRCTDRLCIESRVSSLVWRPGTRQMLVTFTDRNRRQSLFLWDPRASQLRLLIRGEGFLSGGRDGDTPCALGATAAYCVAASASSPPKLVAIDLETGTLSILDDPNAAWRASYTPTVQQLSWNTASGVRVTGTLLLPGDAPARSLPIFINYYSCGGFLRGGEGDEWPIPSLIDSGFAVACVNAAPFTGSQDGIATYRTGLAAVSALVDMLEAKGTIDRRKIAMGGFSFGSEVATWIATHSDLLSCLSIASAQSDPTGYWFNAIGGGDRPAMMRKVWGLGPPEETSARWKMVSAALNSESFHAPVLLQLPEQEARRIPELYARLTEGTTPAELYAYPDEDHLKIQPRHRLAAYQRNLDWFRYWLQDYSDPDPAKEPQFARWDRLRERWKKTGGPGGGYH